MLRLGKAVLCAAFYFAVAAVLIGQPAFAQGKEVRVYNWSDYIDPTISRRLHQGNRHQGRLRRLRFQRDPRNQAAGRRQRLRRRRADGNFLARQIQAGVFQKLDKSKLPNLSNMWHEIYEAHRQLRSGQRILDQLHVGHGRHRLQRGQDQGALPDAPVDRWDVIFKPEIAAKFKDCGVYRARFAGRHAAGGAELSRPRSRTATNPDDIAKAGELLMKIRPYIRKFHSSEYINALANGDICLAVGWSGDVFQARDRADRSQEGRR